MLLILTLLFILLQPGLIITLPPVDRLLTSQTTSTLAILVHAALFFTVAKLVSTNTFPFSLLKDVENQITGKKN